MQFHQHGYRWLLLTVFLFLSSLSLYIYYTYQHTYNQIMDAVDDRLLNAATSINYIIGEHYHDKISGPDHISKANYDKLSRKLSEFADNLELEYVYTMILVQGQVHFTSSSYTHDDLKKDKLTDYFDLYNEATEINRRAFYSTEPVFEYSEDQWGHFKSIFIPYKSNDGRTYLTGADITIKDLNKQLNDSVKQAVISAFFFFFIAVIIAFFYIIVLRRNLSTDSATGYPNYVALEHKLSSSQQLHMQLAIVMINDLEDIVSFYGSHIGDLVMASMLQKLDSRLSEHYQLFRQSNNKIVILSNKLDTEQELSQIIESFNTSTPILTDPFIYITLCAGLAKGNKDLLLENAHIAVMQAKQSRATVVSFSDALYQVKNQYQYNIKMAKEVREAFTQDLLEPHFQSVVSIDGKETLLVEGLARIKQNENHYLTPDAFLSVVNRSRMAGQLTKVMFHKCITRFRNTDTRWSINITAQDMQDPILIEYISNEIKVYPTPSNITLELLETEAIANFNEIKTFIDIIRSYGVSVFIDDFGAGYSNIANILKLNVDGIKLDSALVKQIANDHDVFLFVKYIVEFASQVDLILIAEGVENKITLDALEKTGVKYVQGFYFTKPCDKPKIKVESVSDDFAVH